MKLNIATREWQYYIINFFNLMLRGEKTTHRLLTVCTIWLLHFKNIFNMVLLFDKFRNNRYFVHMFLFCNVLLMFIITLEINIGSREYKFLETHFKMNLKVHYPKGCCVSSYIVWKYPFFLYVRPVRIIEAISCLHRA